MQKPFLSKNMLVFSIHRPLEFVLRVLFKNKWTVVEVMGFWWTGDKLLAQLMMIQITDTYMWH